MPTALVIQHSDRGGPAWFGDWLPAAGLALDVVRPYAGDPVPGSVDRDALVVLGGAMGANDDETVPWLAPTRRLLRAYTGRAAPVLGICLGHQLLAVACGGEVRTNPDGRQRGLLDVGLTGEAAADPLLGGLTPPVRAVQWNNDVVTRLPDGAVLLAAAASGPPQAFRVGRSAWGVQFHPEAGGAQARRWASDDGDGMAEQRRDADAAAEAVATADGELTRTWSAFAARFARLAAAS